MTVGILAVDPGNESGWVRIEFDSAAHMDAVVRQAGPLRAIKNRALAGCVSLGTFSVGDHVGAVAGGRFGECGVVGEFLPMLWGVQVLIIEDFTLARSESSRDLLSPVRIMSMLEYEWVKGPGRTRDGSLIWSNRSNKAAVKDEAMRAAGVWRPGKSGGHINDAVRHLAVFLAGRV